MEPQHEEAERPGNTALRDMQRAIGRGLAWGAAISAGAFVVWQLLGAVDPGWRGHLLAVVAAAGAVGCLLLVERWPRLAVGLLTGLLWTMMTLALVIWGTVFSAALAGYTVVILAAGLVLGVGAALAVAALSLAAAGLMVASGLAGLPEPGSPNANPWHHLVGYAAFFVTAAVMISVARHQIVSAVAALSARERAIRSLAERLRASDSRLNAIARSGFDLVVELDRPDRIAWASPNHLEVVGRSAEDLVGRDPAEWLESPEMQRASEALGAPREDAVSHFRLRGADGAWHWFDMRVAPFRAADGGERLLVVSRDVTEVRAIEEQLAHAQRMEAVGQLAGGIAHDFNNLLTSIGLNLEVIRDDVEDRPEAQQAVGVAMQAADRAAGLTRALLAFSRRQELRPERLDPRVVIEELRPLLEGSLPDSIKLEMQPPASGWACEVDRGHLENAVLNLVINGRDALSGDNGRLAIEVSDVPRDADDPVRPVDLVAGDHVRISVRDTGKGMDPAVVARAFDPFFTTKEQGRGTGLGLSMVYGFARQSGGRATIQSDPGHGTTVHLYLPRARGAPGAD